MKSILVCYEERPVAGRLLERAAWFATLTGAKVIVTSVAPVLHGRGGGIDPVDPPARHEDEVQEAVSRLEELGVESVETVVGIGDPPTAIVSLAEERGVDLIVLGAHDGGLLSRLFEGSTSDAVVHRAGTDVLVVR
jgi:nucleotide-binding universal stress UspA family protein